MPEQITSLDNPRVKRAVKLRDGRSRRQSGLFLAEGSRQVQRVLACGFRVQELFVCAALGGELPAGRPESIACYHVSEPVMNKLAYRKNPGGLLAVVEQNSVSPRDISVQAGGLMLIAVGVEKPGNLGAMARTAAAAGAVGLLVQDAPIDRFNPNAIRASTGAVFELPIVSLSQAELVSWLAEHHVTVWSAYVGAPSVYEAPPPDAAHPLAIAIGPEDTGLPDDWDAPLKAAGVPCRRVGIPTAHGIVDSLNASNAAAVLLFEAVRRGGGVPS